MSIVRKTAPLFIELGKIGVAGFVFMTATLLLLAGPDFLLSDALTHAGLG